MFKEQINHITGKREWVVNEDNFDVAQELARLILFSGNIFYASEADLPI